MGLVGTFVLPLSVLEAKPPIFNASMGLSIKWVNNAHCLIGFL